MPLPNGQFFKDKDGNDRCKIRVKWWDQRADTYHKAIVDPGSAVDLKDGALPAYQHPEFDETKPVFFGHYWLPGKPRLQSHKIACLDFSVAKGGVLCSYSWDGESTLDEAKLSWVHQGANA